MVDWKKRIATAVIGVPVLFYAASFKATAFVAAQIVGFISLQEFAHIMKEVLKKQAPPKYSSYIDELHQKKILNIPIALFFIFVHFSSSSDDLLLYQFITILLISVSGLVKYLLCGKNKEGLEDPQLLLITFSYITGYVFYFLLFIQPLSLAYQFYSFEKGYAIIIFWIVSAFQSDNGALFLGSAIGKNLFSPRISPKKTWEGVFGAILLNVATNVLIYLLNLSIMPSLPLYQYIILGLVGSIASIYGDLLESFIKRASGIKDSGSIFPGHGGLLDRMDSLTFSAPVIFLYFRLFLGEYL